MGRIEENVFTLRVNIKHNLWSNKQIISLLLSMHTGIIQLHENSCVIVNKMKNASYDHEFNHAMTKKYTRSYF